MQNIKFNIPKFQSLSKPMPKDSLNMSNPIDTFEKKAPTEQDTLNELLKIKLNRENRFDKDDVKIFSKLTPKKLNNVKYFAQTNLNTFSIKWIIEKNDVDFEKLANMINEIEKENKGLSVDFKKDSADSNSYILSASSKEGLEKVKMLDENLNVFVIENTKLYGDFKLTEVEDFRNNTMTKMKTDKENTLLSKEKIFKDKAGNTIKTELTEPSEIEGIYNVKIKNVNGNTEIISEGKFDKETRVSTIVKNMTSLNGTKTEYFYQFDKIGNRNSSYKITANDGKVLLNNNEKFTVLSDKKAVSEKNGEKYEMTYKQDEISIQNNGKTTEINLYDFARGDISPLLKLSGNELIQMKNNVTKFGGNKGSFAAYNVFTKEVNTSDNNLSTLLHELGHAKDYRNTDMEISGEENFSQIFEKEKDAFTKVSSNAERSQIGYFIRPSVHHAGADGGKVEVVAEANSILNCCADDQKTAMRKQLLQQYFPETIAILNDKLNKLYDTPVKISSNQSFGH